MPVFLTEKQFAPWLSGEAGAGILKPAPATLAGVDARKKCVAEALTKH